MKVMVGFFISGSILSAVAVQAISYIKQPLDTLSYMYGHTQEISDSVADGTFRGINADQQDVSNGIKNVSDKNVQSNLQSLQNIYSSIDQLEQ